MYSVHVVCLIDRLLFIYYMYMYLHVASYAGFLHFVVEMWKVCARGYVHVHDYEQQAQQSVKLHNYMRKAFHFSTVKCGTPGYEATYMYMYMY